MLGDLHSVYKELLERNRQLTVLGSAEAIVNWDMETMMPPKAVQLRSEQLALLSEVHHKMGTDPQIGRLLEQVQKHPDYESLTQVEKRNVYLIQKSYDEQTKLPTELVVALAKQQAITVNTWKKAKAQKNFALFKPELEKLLDLSKQAANILMQVKGTKTPYDAMLDIYEPKITAETVATVFGELETKVRKLLDQIQSAKQPDTGILHRTVPVEAQREIAKMLMQTLGYETPPSPNAAGRLDETEHPFTTGYYDDVRITTHYYPENFASSVFSVLHETGHALYEQGLPQDWKYQPVGSPCSMGVHESQSRLHENVIGRSLEFWTAALPKLKALASPHLADLTLNQFVAAVNAVKPSKIRIEADEVTYNLHIIVRFQIEQALFADKITVAELPAVWNEHYKKTLDVDVENDSEGVMQDTHWASGMYGYFPTYALGNIYTGQIIQAMGQMVNWQSQVAQGDLTGVRGWLASNIYCAGNLFDPADLIRKATGSPLTVESYMQYLQKKYSGLYGF
jgi:carboxypeptidase Taq